MDSPAPARVDDSTMPNLDITKVEQFGSRMLNLLNHGAITLMISIGYKTNLFETMANRSAVTSAQLAKAANLNERYVREWLAAMYVGGVITIDDDSNSPHAQTKYFLPPENAAFLTWGRGPENVAVLSQYISVLSSLEARTVECFRDGTGIPAKHFGELKSIMAADAAQTVASALVHWILPLGPPSITADLKSGIDVLDIECGSGVNLITLAKEYPMSWFTGYNSDISSIAKAKAAAEQQKLRNVRFKCMEISEASEESSYDLITCFGGLIETGEVRNVVKRVYRSLRRGGTFLLQEVAASSDAKANCAHPAGPLLYAISVMFSVPATIYKTGDDDAAVGLMWGNDTALALLTETGFSCDGPRQLRDDHCNVFFFCSRE